MPAISQAGSRTGFFSCILSICLVVHASVVFGAVEISPEARFDAVKQMATSQELYSFLWQMPKGCDLHNHLQGGGGIATDWISVATNPSIVGTKKFYTRLSMKAGDAPLLIQYRTLQESNYAKLAPEFRADFKELGQLTEAERKAWEASVIMVKTVGGRKLFFDDTFFLRLGDLLRDPNITAEMIVRAMLLASSEHVYYIEGMVGSSWMLDEKGAMIPEDQTIAIFRERLGRPDAVASNVTIRFISSVLRFSDYAEMGIEAAYNTAAKYPDLYVGVNIVGSEQDDRGSPTRFLNVFRKMQRTHPGVGITLHAGEGIPTNENKHVMECLVLGATRIGHAVNLISDPDTLVLMRTGKFMIESCMVSNELVEYTPDISQHPFPIYLRLGIPICLNTDDRGICDSSMTDEYYIATKNFNLSWDEMLQMAQTSIKFSFLPESEKARLLDDYQTHIREFVAKYLSDDWKGALKDVHPNVTGYARRSLSIVGN
jgi:adenosine deaminase CECR1